VDPFVDQLKRLCVLYPTRAKWVFVPTHASGRTLGDRLVLEGTDWANLRFVTPLDIALGMGAPFLVERGIDPSEEGLGPALIMRLLLELPHQPQYFRPLATQPTMAQALWVTVRELRMAGIRAQSLTPAAFVSGAKHIEFQALVAAYETFLATNARGDVATVYEEAAGHPDWCPVQPQDCWTELPDVLWAPLQRRLIEAMPGERILPRATELPGAVIPRRLASAPVQRVRPESGSTLALLLSPKQVEKAHNIQLFHAGGRDAEVAEVFRRILVSGRSLDEVEISCPTDAYATLIWEKACRYDWPVTVAAGLPATLTRPGRALIGLSSWIESDFGAGVLRRLLQSRDLTLGSSVEITPARAARLLVKSEAAWGRATYEASLARLATRYRTWAAQEDLSDDQRTRALAKANEADQLRRWIGELLASIPESVANGPVELQQLVDCALQFVDTFAATSSALDSAAVAALRDSITELKALGSFECSLADGLRFLRERVGGLSVGADRPRPGHLHVSMLSQAALANRRSLFVVGLEEGRVFPASFEDPVLLDPEREQINPLLRRSTDRIEEAVYAALSRLAAAGADSNVEVCLSYSCRDLREYRHTFPSWLMLQAYRAVSGNPNKSYDELSHALGPSKSCVPEFPSAALDETGWWLNGLTRAGKDGRMAVLGRYPGLAEGIRAEQERASAGFTEYDGYVPSAGELLDPCTREQAVSATQLENAAECPFRYFLSRGLGIDAVDDGGRERDAWLDPRTRGSELHDLYARLLRRCRDESRLPTIESDREWFVTQGKEVLDRLRNEMPPPSAEVLDREQCEFLEDLKLFIEAECRGDQSRVPLGLEVSFGKSTRGEQEEPLDQLEPIVIELGNGLRFRLAGRIDRIDQIGSSSFEVIDYKTGGYFEPDWKGVFAGGRRLQHALYGLAAAELLRRRHQLPTIVGGQYYFSAAKGRQERVSITKPSPAAMTAVLADLRQVIASGLFVHAKDESACKWCELGAACGANPFERARAKLADPKLDPYRRLIAHD
jgi:RecB family exonuclease